MKVCDKCGAHIIDARKGWARTLWKQSPFCPKCKNGIAVEIDGKKKQEANK